MEPRSLVFQILPDKVILGRFQGSLRTSKPKVCTEDFGSLGISQHQRSQRTKIQCIESRIRHSEARETQRKGCSPNAFPVAEHPLYLGYPQKNSMLKREKFSTQNLNQKNASPKWWVEHEE